MAVARASARPQGGKDGPHGPNRSLRTVDVGESRRDEWDALAGAEIAFCLMQSWEWGDFKQRMGWRPFRIGVERNDELVAGAQILVRPLPGSSLSVAYVPRGPVGAWLEDDLVTLLLEELTRVARSQRAVFLRVEPPLPNASRAASVLCENAFRSAAYTNQPRATILVDLTRELDDVLAGMHSKTRYNIRYAARKGVTLEVGRLDDVAEFHALMRQTARRGGFSLRALDYYRRQWEAFVPRGEARLFMAVYKGSVLAVNLSARFGERAAYLHGGSSGEHSNLMPNHFLMWEAMRWAKAGNCRTFDLWGIPDEVGIAVDEGRPPAVPGSEEDLWGVYRFKRGFGGDIVLHAAAHDYICLRSFYPLVARALGGARMFDKLAASVDRARR